MRIFFIFASSVLHVTYKRRRVLKFHSETRYRVPDCRCLCGLYRWYRQHWQGPHITMKYSHASLNDGDTPWEISSVTQCHIPEDFVLQLFFKFTVMRRLTTGIGCEKLAQWHSVISQRTLFFSNLSVYGHASLNDGVTLWEISSVKQCHIPKDFVLQLFFSLRSCVA